MTYIIDMQYFSDEPQPSLSVRIHHCSSLSSCGSIICMANMDDDQYDDNDNEYVLLPCNTYMKIQQDIYTNIHPCCNDLTNSLLELHMVNGTGSRGLCAPISIIGNCLMVLGKWRNAIKKKTEKQKTTVQFVLFSHTLLSHNQQSNLLQLAYHCKTLSFR